MDGEERSKRCSAFPETRWTVVLQAGEGSTEALETLCRAYRRPIQAFIHSYTGGMRDTEDLTPGFFTDEIVPRKKSRLFLGVDRDRPFRTWLLGAVTHYVHRQQQMRSAQKRNCGVSPLSLDQGDTEDGRPLVDRAMGHRRTPEQVYHYTWALEVVHRALDRLEHQQATERSSEKFRLLRPYLVGPEGEDPIYAPVAGALGKTVRSVAVDVCHLRKQFGEILNQEIADTLANPRALDEERRFLLAALTLPPESTPMWTRRDA